MGKKGYSATYKRGYKRGFEIAYEEGYKRAIQDAQRFVKAPEQKEKLQAYGDDYIRFWKGLGQ